MIETDPSESAGRVLPDGTGRPRVGWSHLAILLRHQAGAFVLLPPHGREGRRRRVPRHGGVKGVWAALSLLLGLGTAAAAASEPLPAADFVGGKQCEPCHEAAYRAWRGSHHHDAMQAATAASVRASFKNTSFTYAGLTSKFFQRGDRMFVRTDGADGKMHDFPIKYTFGVDPLQQYLIELQGGRLQALSIAWDTRPKVAGGQRWFHLYPDETITHTDELHWTGPQQNWNFMCADCHSTNLRKNYDAVSRTFQTTWSEINVGCEACHGPGSRHVSWARRKATGESALDTNKGLTVVLDERRLRTWNREPEATSVKPQGKPPRTELETCAPCHARRAVIAPGFSAGKAFLDYYQPSLLEPDLYYPDGQQRGEVYVWGSFVQSKMYQSGVTCADCHEPHDLRLRAPGNSLCASCHAAEKYDASTHHFHKPGGAGAACVDCHMPETTYMILDPRRDHSLRVPRPDLSQTLGVPNACNSCHRDKTAAWATAELARRFGNANKGFQRFGRALHAAAHGSQGSAQQLVEVLEDPSQPEIARATAASWLARNAEAGALQSLLHALADSSPLVRRAAVAAVEALPVEQRPSLAAPLLDDPVRLVRIGAARALAGARAALSPAQLPSFQRAGGEFEAAQRLNADRAEHRANLGTYYGDLGRLSEADTELREAVRLVPGFAPAWANLADLYRAQGRDQEAAAILLEGLKTVPSAAPLHHALGLTYIRLQRRDEGIAALAEATRLAPEEARFAYVYAIALHSVGRTKEALLLLDRALGHRPGDHDLLLAAATLHRDTGDLPTALAYAEKLLASAPRDPNAHQLVEELRRATRR